MADDYRNTKYCPEMGNIEERKNSLVAEIRKTHPRATDMYAILSKELSHRDRFFKAYHAKCAYCGVSLDILPCQMFEIDHFIPKASCKFGGSKAAAGNMKNLVLACHDCNRWKSDFDTSGLENDLHPDYEGITQSFFRDSQYYIRVSAPKENDSNVKAFYNQLHLGNELRRVDYLLMNMRGMYDAMKLEGMKPEVLKELLEAIHLLQKKRNRMGLHTEIT